MEDNLKEIKTKKRKLKPAVKVILFLLFFGIIFFVIYKSDFISSAKIFFQNSYTKIKNIIPGKDPDQDLEANNNNKKDFLSIFKKRLSTQNIDFASSTLMPNGDLKIFLKNTKDNAGYIYVNTKDNVEEVWNTFSSILIAEPVKDLLNKDLTNLNYVDLRFKNKVFYKFNNLTNPSSTSTSTSSVISSATTSSTTNTN